MISAVRKWWTELWRKQLESEFLRLKCPYPGDTVRQQLWLSSQHVSDCAAHVRRAIEHGLSAADVKRYQRNWEDAQRAHTQLTEWAKDVKKEVSASPADEQPRPVDPNANAANASIPTTPVNTGSPQGPGDDSEEHTEVR